jgi:two-component system, chemotaxis family, chemotaxis protein CheY
MSILIIEDDEGVGPSIAHLLRDEGYAVDVATGGRVALQILARDPLPSLILLDLMMPEMDGIEFRERQLADSRLASIPVIVISARPDVALRAKQLLADDFLQKPMRFEELLLAVQNCAITVVTARASTAEVP